MTSRHLMMMNRSSGTGAGELETFAMANCLMLLNSQTSTIPTRGRATEDESTWFPCKTCGRKFPSFQALGGHRASHKKIKSAFSDHGKEESKPISSPEKPKTHVCTICGAEFPIGQALGGHMRRHRQTPVSGGGSTLTTETSEVSGGGDHHDSNDHKKRKLDGEVIVMVPNLKRSSSGKRVCLDDLDLNLYLWNDKCDGDENDGRGVDEGEVVEVVDDEMDFLKLELRQPIN